MLYFPLFSIDLPTWFPINAGKRFNFFEPVFNIADMAISTGFIMLIVFNKKAFPKT
jgi:signal peptidase II